MSEATGACATHAGALAGFQCTSCGALLCDHCVEVTKYLILCGSCGEQAQPLAGVHDPRQPEPVQSTFKTFDSGEKSATANLLIQLTNHVVVPGAIIAMVTALFFFLIDLRSVLLPGGLKLKWLGFWFVFGTVLIARYGRQSADRERQGCYTTLLAGAMTLVLFIEPWEKNGSGPIGILMNLTIVAGVWFFASRVTASLSREGEDEVDPRRLKLFGLERLELESFEQGNEDARLRVKRKLRGNAEQAKQLGDAFGNPNAAVASLAIGALAVFAIGEPLILAGPPQVGVRALVAVVVFLFSTGLVLSAGSAVGTLRHAKKLEGRVTERLVPVRVMSGGILTLVLLAVLLAMPGIAFRGSGELQPISTSGAQSQLGDAGESSDSDEDGEQDNTADSEAQGESASQDQEGPSKQGGYGQADAGEPASGKSKSGQSKSGQSESGQPESGQPESGQSESGQQRDSSSRAGESLAATSRVLGGLTTLGKYLIWPFLLAVILGGLYVLVKLAPQLGKLKLSGFGGWLARLAAALRGLRKPRQTTVREAKLSADVAMHGLRELPPREAVITAYARLLPALEAVGYPRETRTPDEVLAALPDHLRRLRKSLGILTPIYVRAAYGSEEIAESERETAVSAMVDLRRLLPRARAEKSS